MGAQGTEDKERSARMIWQELSAPWQAAVEEAWKAYCAGSIPIGAAIADAQKRVVARGRNCRWESSPEGYALAGNRIAHAEMNALLAFESWEGRDLATYTLYTTMEPCPMCMGAIRMVHMGRVCYAARDVLAGSASLVDVPPYTRLGRIVRRIEVVGPPRVDLELVLLAIQAECLLHHPRSRWAEVVERREPEQIPGIQLGRRLHASGELARQRDAGIPAGEVIDLLAEMLGEGEFAPRAKRAQARNRI
jgi:tRNA(adenine34) deaminase